jgi:hypothetical protein
VRFVLGVDQCAYVNEAMQLVVERGPLEIMVGTSSEDLPLHATVQIEEGSQAVDRRAAFFSTSEII